MKKINIINSVLHNSKELSQIIIESELNCEWLNDVKEKEYLESIINYIYELIRTEQII